MQTDILIALDLTSHKSFRTSEYIYFTFVSVSVFACVRIAVFSVTVFYDERVVIVAEQRPDASEEDSFQWMSRVLQVIVEQHFVC